jgi:FkbH-like protein
MYREWKNVDDAKVQSVRQGMKCVVWDLDNTLWQGTLSEGDDVSVRNSVLEIIQTLDTQGVLQSIASKNNYAQALEKLKSFHLDEYFLYPQISWQPKSQAIKFIASSLNIGLDTIVFVDDQAFERDEVQYSLPQVFCIDATQFNEVYHLSAFNLPDNVTDEARQRRQMYQSEIKRKQDESDFEGQIEDFLASLQMTLSIRTAQEQDLLRAEELTIRTHQLNTTGYTYSQDELNAFRISPVHNLYIAHLEDKYGSYGIIGLLLLERSATCWSIKLLLVSCRVMNRGVGTVMINYILQLAKDSQARLQAEFVANNLNRMMYVTYKFAGFKEVKHINELIILENDLSHIQAFPSYMDVRVLP